MDTNPTLAPLCPYDMPDGSKCLSDKVLARGYCERHYRTLRRAGAFEDLASKHRTPNETVLANVRSVKRARRKLLKNIPDYVDLHLSASKIAATKGDSRPMEWALTHTRVVDPPAKSVDITPTTLAPIINIGVKVSGVNDSNESK